MIEQVLEKAKENLAQAVAGAAPEDEREYFAVTEGIQRCFSFDPRAKGEICGMVVPGVSPAVASTVAEFCGFGNAPICLLTEGHEGIHVNAIGETWEESTQRVETRTCDSLQSASSGIRCSRPKDHKGPCSGGGLTWRNRSVAPPPARRVNRHA
jgi:hypothetical protein